MHFFGATSNFKRGASKTFKTIGGGNIHYEASYGKIHKKIPLNSNYVNKSSIFKILQISVSTN